MFTGCSIFRSIFNGNTSVSASAIVSAKASIYSQPDLLAPDIEEATVSASAKASATSTPTQAPKPSPIYVNGKACYLTFQDDFNGTSLNRSTWYCETGDGSSSGLWRWGNEEDEYYLPQNAVVSDGTLKIIAKKESRNGYQYTSARINTKNSFSQTYGRFEAKIKLPAERGMWPAFWLLPVANTYNPSGNTWPANGEIDIMESKGRLPTTVSCALHWANSSGQDKYSSRWLESSGYRIDDWHVYAVEWTSSKIEYYVDNTKLLTVNRSDWNGGFYSGKGTTAPFDKNFYIILNLAVGGKFDKENGVKVSPSDDFVSATMEIDYVKVYKFA